MKQIQRKILNWHLETFPNATEQAILDKLREEATELIEAIQPVNHKNIAEEIADVFIVSTALFGRCGVSFEDVVRYKLEINKERDWGKETENGDRPRERS